MRDFDPDVWKQTSRKYRHVARLPPGKTGIQALKDASPDECRRVEELLERQCAAQYLRLYAAKEGFREELTEEEFENFKANGGEGA